LSEEIIRKTYLCPVIGTGSPDDSFRAKVSDYGVSCFMHRLSVDYCLVVVVAPASVHDVIAADPEIRLVAIRKTVQLSEAELTVITQQYGSFNIKWKAAKKSSVKFEDDYGEG